MKQTAVEWLVDNFGYVQSGNMSLKYYFEQAKEMEKQQQDELAIGFAEWIEELSRAHIDSLDYYLYLDNDVKELLEIYKKGL